MAKVVELMQFDRQELRKASRFIEGDYSGINPRKFYRALRRKLGEIQEDGDFKYHITGDRDHHLEIRSEAVGDKTGVVTGRLRATSEQAPVGPGTTWFRPWGPYGALLSVIGAFVTILGLQWMVFWVAGPLTVAAGLYLFAQEELGEIPLKSRDSIRTLIEGEVSEKTINTESGTRTEMSGSMSVIYSGDVFLEIPPEDFRDLSWSLRIEILSKLRVWEGRISKDDPITSKGTEPQETSAGFVDCIRAFAQHDASWAARRLKRFQERLQGDFESRQEYAEILTGLLAAPDVRDSELNKIVDELESLKGGMEVYVDREGLQARK